MYLLLSQLCHLKPHSIVKKKIEKFKCDALKWELCFHLYKIILKSFVCVWLNKHESAWKNTYQVIKIVYVGWGSTDKEGRQVSFITIFAFCIIMFLHDNFYLYAFPVFRSYPHSLAGVPLLYLQSQQWLRGAFFTSYHFDTDSDSMSHWRMLVTTLGPPE